MDEKVLEAILLSLARLERKLDQQESDFNDVAERFEEIATLIEQERRIDRYGAEDE